MKYFCLPETQQLTTSTKELNVPILCAVTLVLFYLDFILCSFVFSTYLRCPAGSCHQFRTPVIRRTNGS